ncbi:ABC transporter substrate-binding protein [Candidatus Woesearchaeota archaeon]|nr:ABC transporter substrate-binding protein [Candidatus Woesearchaeota archaeon]
MKNENKKITICVGLLLISFMLTACAVQEKQTELQDVNLKLKWLHQSQFAGNYVAKNKGFYEQEGLNVTIEPFSFENPTIETVITGNADFGITSANELMLAKAQGLPLKAFAVIFKISPDCAYSLKDSNITKPQDFVGKTIGIEPGVSGEKLYYLMTKRLNIDRTNIKEVYIGYDATELLNGTTDVSLGYIINEPHQVIESGHEVNTILFADYGINTYADVLFATEETINDKPELVEKFLRATLEGWRYAIENEGETVDIVLQYATDRTKSHEAYMLNQAIPLIHTGKSPIGVMEKKEWENVQNILLEQNMLTEKIFIEEIYTNEFVLKIYEQ